MKNARLLLTSLLVLSALPALAAAGAPRIFDIVPPPGREVQLVDGLTVLRQPGTAFGAVLTFMPENDTQAWIPLAVLNTGRDALKVGTDGVTVRSGSEPLKVWSSTALVRWLKDGRSGLPTVAGDARATATAPRRADTSFMSSEAPIAPAPPQTIGPVEPGTQTQGSSSAGLRNIRTNAEQVAMDRERARIDAARDRLFRSVKLEPRGVARGDVLFALPPRGAGAPAEFVVTLAFGGETMDVRYRERTSPVDVGAAVPTE